MDSFQLYNFATCNARSRSQLIRSKSLRHDAGVRSRMPSKCKVMRRRESIHSICIADSCMTLYFACRIRGTRIDDLLSRDPGR